MGFGGLAGAVARAGRTRDEIERQRMQDQQSQEQAEIQKLALMSGLAERGVSPDRETIQSGLPGISQIGDTRPQRPTPPSDAGIVDPSRYQSVGKVGGKEYYRDRAKEIAAQRAAERQQRIDEALKMSQTEENTANAARLRAPQAPERRNIDPLSPEGLKAFEAQEKIRAANRPVPVRQTLPTEGERKASALLTTGEQAYKTLEHLLAGGKKTPSWTDQTLAKVGMGAGNMMTGDENRRMRQAALQLSDAWLRYTSGAAVPESEVERFAAQFIPTAGDDDGTLGQKAMARRTIIHALRQGAGRAAAPKAPAVPFPEY